MTLLVNIFCCFKIIFQGCVLDFVFIYVRLQAIGNNKHSHFSGWKYKSELLFICLELTIKYLNPLLKIIAVKPIYASLLCR